MTNNYNILRAMEVLNLACAIWMVHTGSYATAVGNFGAFIICNGAARDAA
jgi:hypothetical protein